MVRDAGIRDVTAMLCESGCGGGWAGTLTARADLLAGPVWVFGYLGISRRWPAR